MKDAAATAATAATATGAKGTASAATARKPHHPSNGQGNSNAAASSTGAQGPGPASKYRHVAAVHYQARPSVLSHESQATPSFLGFRNLMVIVLIAGNLRLVIENMQKYGVLICLRCHDFRRQDLLLGLGLYFLIPVSLFVAYTIELAAAHQAIRSHRRITTPATPNSEPQADKERRRFQSLWQVIAWAHGVNVTLALIVTSYVVYYHIHHPLIGTITEMHAVIVWLKTASYALTNRDLRHAYLHPAAGELAAIPNLYDACPYPGNIAVSNLCYFWWAPTLVYQPVYPRTESVRWIFVVKRVGEVLILNAFIWFATAQYAAPVLMNSLETIESLNVFSILERLLKLSTISLAIWLAGFFALFQSFLNALAEVLRFGDRAFYDDWWNSESLGAYWRTWNKPVYQFFKRHVYSPMVGRGWSQTLATLTVFTLSALLHEVLVGVPTHNIIGVAFLGMMVQLPLIAITRPVERMANKTGRLVGNCIFWVSFTVFGQPFAALMYFYAWQAKYGNVSRT